MGLSPPINISLSASCFGDLCEILDVEVFLDLFRTYIKWLRATVWDWLYRVVLLQFPHDLHLKMGQNLVAVETLSNLGLILTL